MVERIIVGSGFVILGLLFFVLWYQDLFPEDKSVSNGYSLTRYFWSGIFATLIGAMLLLGKVDF
ncbi:MAG: hypothetical protein DWQ02_20635 [Bacteroidetes bacterium]|nr:MAG: hypothetical protein DWQ02_20635 [Bacteroidota bacterium]